MVRNILMVALSTFLTLFVVTSPLLYGYLSTIAPEWAVRRFDPAAGNGDPLFASIMMTAMLATPAAVAVYSWVSTFIGWKE